MKLEVNIIVRSAREAADFYEKVFGAKILSKTDLEQGLNETIMIIAGTEFRVLDENEGLGMVGPSENVPASMGINLFVDDIYAQAKVAEEAGCVFLVPVTEYPESNAINAVFRDIFGHLWVINQKMD